MDWDKERLELEQVRTLLGQQQMEDLSQMGTLMWSPFIYSSKGKEKEIEMEAGAEAEEKGEEADDKDDNVQGKEDETQTENLDCLIDSLKGHDIQEADYEDHANFTFPELHNLLWSVVGQSINSSWGGPFEKYLWLRALKEDGNFSDLHHESEVQAGSSSSDDGKASDIKFLGQIHEKILRMGIPAPFNRLYEMQQYMISLVLSQLQDVKVYLDPEM
ncbi:hypothetical protein SCLCIDRAFT_29256 [Scleroderma citrinum Foug A]|uniref:Uncharacterized protein n=1 Tax=Scleroderma citrinum Foug A TaxID=1036808 RepID=A0A0C2ZWH7_9AGAM|nr:hypothetical protein SCLCIDRAFT_29256 [Scleroderma citrinum Foug A]